MGLFKEITESFKDLKGNIDFSKEKLALVQQEAEKAQKVGQKIQSKVEEFQFNIQGNLDKINEISEKYKASEANETAKPLAD